MDRVVTIAIDLSGPSELIPEKIAGCIDALAEKEYIKLIMLGNPSLIEGALSSYGPLMSRIRIVPAMQDIPEQTSVVAAVREYRDSAFVKGMEILKDDGADAFVSCLSPVFISNGAQLIIGRIKGIGVSPIATLVPGQENPFIMLDSGASGAGIRAADIVTYARMGSLYGRFLLGKEEPGVGLLSDSRFPENGGMLYRESFELLRRNRDFAFSGTVTPEELFKGKADVVVCDGFSGSLLVHMISGFAADFASSCSTKRRYGFFGKSREQDTEASICAFDINTKGLSFFPGLTETVTGICEKPKRDTVRMAVSYSTVLAKEDIKGRLTGLLRL